MTASYFEIAHSVATLIKYRVSGHGVIIGMSDITVLTRVGITLVDWLSFNIQVGCISAIFTTRPS